MAQKDDIVLDSDDDSRRVAAAQAVARRGSVCPVDLAADSDDGGCGPFVVVTVRSTGENAGRRLLFPGGRATPRVVGEDVEAPAAARDEGHVGSLAVEQGPTAGSAADAVLGPAGAENHRCRAALALPSGLVDTGGGIIAGANVF